jgi:hypothetical protein
VYCYSTSSGRSFVENPPTSITAVSVARERHIGNVRNGATCVWKPVDSSTDEFCDLANAKTHAIFGFHVTGCSPDVPFTVDVVVNYEGIRNNSSFRVGDESFSPVNHLVYEKARLSSASGPSITSNDSYYDTLMSKFNSVNWNALGSAMYDYVPSGYTAATIGTTIAAEQAYRAATRGLMPGRQG